MAMNLDVNLNGNHDDTKTLNTILDKINDRDKTLSTTSGVIMASSDSLTAGPGALKADPYDPSHLGLSQDFVTCANVAKVWDIIRVGKPSNSRVFRVHPDLQLKTILLVLKEENEFYLVQPEVRPFLVREPLCGTFTLFPCMSKGGTPFLWPICMGTGDGKWNIWHSSAFEIALKARMRWTRMYASRDAGHYLAEYDQRDPMQQGEPIWPDLILRDWIELAFRGYTIDSLDHPILRRLRMED
jgi:hypothetical protein